MIFIFIKMEKSIWQCYPSIAAWPLSNPRETPVLLTRALGTIFAHVNRTQYISVVPPGTNIQPAILHTSGIHCEYPVLLCLAVVWRQSVSADTRTAPSRSGLSYLYCRRTLYFFLLRSGWADDNSLKQLGNFTPPVFFLGIFRQMSRFAGLLVHLTKARGQLARYRGCLPYADFFGTSMNAKGTMTNFLGH